MFEVMGNPANEQLPHRAHFVRKTALPVCITIGSIFTQPREPEETYSVSNNTTGQGRLPSFLHEREMLVTEGVTLL